NSSRDSPLLSPLPGGEGQGEGERDSYQYFASELHKNKLRPVLSEPAALEKVGHGALVVLDESGAEKIHGRAITVADRLGGERVVLAKWIRRLTNWGGRQAPLALWRAKIAPLVEQKLAQQKLTVVRFKEQA